ncbi:MAG: response regulator [Ignavibacteria bacterium]|jgi:CheY-like chemotaxis protein|nr:response regulator [Ignavibacteria bacterium]
MNLQFDILVVDDEQVIIDSVIKIAKMEDVSIDSALDVPTALIKLETNNYNLIFSDIMMPGMDGFQFLQEIAQRKIKTPVIITTGYSTLDNTVKALYYGAVGFIPKPFSFDELSSIIKRGLRYNALLKKMEEDSSALFFIPCPPKYLRLGFSSWLAENYDSTVLLGTTDILLKLIESIEKVELLNVDDGLKQGNECAKIFAEDGLIHTIYSSVTGRILEVNEKLLSNPKLIEKDPYFEGWIYRVLPSDLENEKSQLISCSSD